MRTYDVGILGATGMVGQRFITLVSGHPWFRVKALAASKGSAQKSYEEAVSGRWRMSGSIPEDIAKMTVYDAVRDREKIAEMCDFVFCAVDMDKEEIRAFEDAYAKLECPVVSNNSAHRGTPDVPMVVPEINHRHTGLIEHQRKRLGVKRGFVAVKPNCSLQCYVLPLEALMPLKPKAVLACTYQAISGAGKTLQSWPEMVDNVIPYIAGEEEKSEREPLKIWGELKDGVILPKTGLDITTQCVRVPVSDGHMAAVFASFEEKASIGDMERMMRDYRSLPQELKLPSAPALPVHVFDQPDRPQARLDREIEGGMAVSVGRLREDSQYDVKFICCSHNTLRGAAGGAVLLAELLCSQGYIE